MKRGRAPLPRMRRVLGMITGTWPTPKHRGAGVASRGAKTRPSYLASPRHVQESQEDTGLAFTAFTLGLEKIFRTQGLDSRARSSAQLSGPASGPGTSRLAVSATPNRTWKLRHSLLAMETRDTKACTCGVAAHVEGPCCLDLELCTCSDELLGVPAQHSGCLQARAG